MAQQALAGLPRLPPFNSSNSPTSSTINGAGLKIGVTGPVFIDGYPASKALHKIWFRFGAITKANGTGLTISTQALSTTTGPMQPTGTQIQTVAIANGDANFASNTWYQTAALSADVTVTPGQLIAIVMECDGGGFKAGDSITWSNQGVSLGTLLASQVSTFDGATWSLVSNVSPNVIFEFSDGTYGGLIDGFPFKTLSNHAYNSGSATNEFANQFQINQPLTMAGVRICMQAAGVTSAFNVILYDGTTALQTLAVDAHQLVTTATDRIFSFLFTTPQALLASHTYYVSVQPSSVNNVTVNTITLASSGQFAAHPFGSTAQLVSRSGGAWSAPTTTEQIIMEPIWAKAADNTSGGGGTSRSRTLTYS